MQFQVEVISVSAPQTVPTKNGKSYQTVEVAYRKDGKIEGKKIMSFTNPSVFKAVQQFNQGDLVTITAEKNDAGYWQWENVTLGSGASAPATTQSAATQGGGTTKSTGGNWETKEERAARQVMIVRQSSISSAVALLGNKAKAADVISVAKEFESYVMGTDAPSAVKGLMEMEDDIPM